MSDHEELLQLASVLDRDPVNWYHEKRARYADLLRRVAKRIAPRVDNVPTSPEAKMVANLFKRKLTTPWSIKEIKSFKACMKRGVLTEESMQILSRYYETQRAKPDGIQRRDIFTFLNNFDGELDRANLMTAKKNGSNGSGFDDWPTFARTWMSKKHPTIHGQWRDVPHKLKEEFYNRSMNGA